MSDNTPTSQTYTYSNGPCHKCGKPYIYVGDIIGEPKDYICICNNDNPLEWETFTFPGDENITTAPSPKKISITDQYGDLLIELEVGDKYHKMILEVGLNKILKDAIEHWTKDDADYYTGPEPGKNEYVVKVEEDVDGCAVINLPDELMTQMGWEEGDNIGIEETMNCFDDGECQGLVLTNLTKDRINENNS